MKEMARRLGCTMRDLISALRFVWRKHRDWPAGRHWDSLAADVYLAVTNRKIRALFAEDPDWVSPSDAQRPATPEVCGPCGHPAGWHLHGPETWGDCDGADCDCETYTPRSEWDAVDFGAGWL